MLIAYTGTNGEVLVVAAEDEARLLDQWFGFDKARLTADDATQWFEDNPKERRLPSGVEIYEREEAYNLVQIGAPEPQIDVHSHLT